MLSAFLFFFFIIFFLIFLLPIFLYIGLKAHRCESKLASETYAKQIYAGSNHADVRLSDVGRVGGFLAVGRPIFAALTQYESVEVCCGKLTQWHVAWMVSVLV